MSDANDSQPSYGKMMLLAAPAFAAKSVVGDLPKASLENAVENKALGGSKSFAHYLAQGVKGKGTGRMLGGAIGIATAPLYLKGISLLQSKNKEDRTKGYELVAAGTAAFAGSKGFLENFLSAKLRGENPLAAAGKGLFLGTVRSGYKIPLALATAAGIAAGRNHKSKNGQSSGAMRYAMPAVAGAGAGALSRVIESASEHAMYGKPQSVAVRAQKLLSAGAGGAAGGLLGGLVLAGAANATEKLLRGNKPHEKTSSLVLGTAGALAAVKGLAAWSGANAALATAGAAGLKGGLLAAGNSVLGIKGLMGATHFGALPELLVGSTLAHSMSRKAYGYKAPVWDFLAPKGGKVDKAIVNWATRARARQFAMGLKEGLVGLGHSGIRSQALSNNLLIPEFIALRHMGNGLGRQLRNIPEEQRAQYLRRIQKAVVDHPTVLKGLEGEHNPIMAPVFGGISMALGDRGRYRFMREGGKVQKAYDAVMYGGHGVNNPGLPTKLGPLQKHPGVLRENLGNAIGMLGAAGAGALGAPGPLVGHMAFNNIKPPALEMSFPVNIKQMAHQDIAKGVYRGIFPGIGAGQLRSKENLVKEYMVSPATTQMHRALTPVTTAMRDEVIKDALQGARNKASRMIEDAAVPKKTNAVKAIAVPVGIGAGTGLAGYMALRNKSQTDK